MSDSKQSQGDAVHKREFIPAGKVIMKEGETGESAFLIQSGSVSVSVTDEKTGKPVKVAILTAGQIFGEMALITATKRSATVKAAQDCNLILITREQLEEKLKKSDPTVRALVPMLMKRLSQTNETLVRRDQSIDDIIASVKAMYETVATPLIPSKRKTFQNLVKPKMDGFLQALKSYKDRYQNDD